ncbi:hypothetical protein TGAM01_v210918 [Trichoderma gamsii]|uniref:Uncharacterized protein n=1 Tax=Trichoderma gamsii TaxID=398673 RepID=A0A2P4Z7D6_9HYPO|nr:hypothetical protein TGAM01_v210918 [Trichoderma gamsii]PON20197.1 hypothetical protein TGAM01_v210918 [Trichoderma gamsii]
MLSSLTDPGAPHQTGCLCRYGYREASRCCRHYGMEPPVHGDTWR